MSKFIVNTQVLENYGVDSGEEYWKPKGGEEFLVEGAVDSKQAFDFVAKHFSTDNDFIKEYVLDVVPFEEWKSYLPQDKEYRDFVLSQVWKVSVENLELKSRGLTEDELR